MLRINTTKAVLPLLVCCNLVFIILYFILLYYNRYAADDYFFVYNAKTLGIIGAAVFTAQTWTSRPAEMLLYNTMTNYLSEQAVLIGYGAGVLILLLFAVYKLLRLFVNKLDNKLSGGVLFNYSLLFCCSFFFASFSIGETWFWLCSSLGYLLSLVALLWGVIFLINKKNNLLTYIFSLVCFGYVTGAAETFAAMVLFIAWIWILIRIYQNRLNLKSLFDDSIFKKLFFITILSSIAFATIYFGTGSQFRKSILTQASFFETFFIAAKTMAYVFIKKAPAKLAYLILFSAPFLLVGKRLLKNVSTERIFSRKNFFRVCFLFISVTFISFLPASYIMSDRGPERSFTINAFLLAFLFMCTFTYLGYKIQHAYINFIVVVGLLLNLFLLIYINIQHYSIAKNYAKAIDRRIEFVLTENEKGRTELLELNPLPASSFYYSTELSADTAYYTNAFFRQRFGLKFNCRVQSQ